jgi:hypothetical protein
MIEAAQTVLADIETTAIERDENGLMKIPETVHLIVARDYERAITHVFGPSRESLEEGVDFLRRSHTVVFHNGIGFDLLVLEHNFGLKATHELHFVDSLVLCQLFYSNVKEEEDFAMFEKHKMRPAGPLKFTGDLMGSHSLEAWGLRLNPPCPKGDYAERMEEQGIDPWAAWNQQMQDYAIQDVEVLTALWTQKLRQRFIEASNKQAIAIEHYMAELMDQTRTSGIYLDLEWTEALCADLERRSEEVAKIIEEEFPPRLEPVKWKYHKIRQGEFEIYPHEREDYERLSKSDEPDDIAERMRTWGNRQRQQLTPLMLKFPSAEVYRPHFNLPDGYVREMYGEATNPKVDRKVKDKETGEVIQQVFKGEPFTKVHLAHLNAKSRPQIVRRLLELGWVPTEFTDAGNPETNEVELAKIEEQFPQAKNIAKYLLIEKRLGQIKTGKKAWLKFVGADGKIHPTIRACNTVAFRATHSDPNISQVPSVKMRDVVDAEGNKVVKEVPKVRYVYDHRTKLWTKEECGTELKVKQEPLKGDEGKWGWDCRRCFTVKPGWIMVGSDLAGIEMRAWAHYLWPYDNGKFADIVLNKDVHEENRVILGFANRRDAKSWLYAIMYGAGDEKLGSVIEPTSSPARHKMIGGASRARFMSGLEGYRELNEGLMTGVKRGWLKGLDGRRVPVRKQHAALNALLQSAGAIISKYWIYFTLDILENEYDLKWGWDNDFTLLLYSHDELQFACKPEHQAAVEDACTRGALKAGRHLKFRLDVEVGLAHGTNWADTH